MTTRWLGAMGEGETRTQGALGWIASGRASANRPARHHHDRRFDGFDIASHDLPLVVPTCVAFVVMGCTIAVALDER
jgi:hypothetical protein